MTTRSQRAAGDGDAHALYHRSQVPGIYCATLVDDGPPRTRIHDRLVLLTLTHGKVVVRCRGEVHDMQPGSVLMVEPGEVHRDLRKTSYRAVMVVLQAELVNTLRGSRASGRLGPVVVRSPELCAQMFALNKAVTEGCGLAVQEERAALLVRLLDPLWATSDPRPEPALVSRVRRALEELPGGLVSLDELAARLRCSPTYLCRVFADHMGLGPHAFQLQQRLLQARLLIESGHTVAVAAAASGFNDESHLHRYFRRRFALAPGRYKTNLGGLDDAQEIA